MECYHTDDLGASYQGQKNISLSGKVCKKWNKMGYGMDDFDQWNKLYGFDFKNNFCRRPGAQVHDLHVKEFGTAKAPLCFTDEDVVEICAIDKCGMSILL